MIQMDLIETAVAILSLRSRSIRMSCPHEAVVRRVRFWIRAKVRTTVLVWVILGCNADAATAGSLAEQLLGSDASSLADVNSNAVHKAFSGLVAHARPCVASGPSRYGRCACTVQSLFGETPITPASEPSTLGESTMTGALTNHRGSCAALAAIALSVADDVGVELEAWVRADHVVVAAPRADGYFELLHGGAFHPWGPNRSRGWTRVKPSDYLGYYLDNLAVRLADAHDLERADATFHRAIDATPKAARLRFNYGTFLLNQKRLPEAAEQLRRAVRRDGRNVDAWTNLGVVNAQGGDPVEARKCFNQALRIDPRNANARRNLDALASTAPTSSASPPR
jgi:tetratricopeptide (TPR) repeat protein